MSQSTITFLILGVTVAVFVWDRLPAAVVARGVAGRKRSCGLVLLTLALGRLISRARGVGRLVPDAGREACEPEVMSPGGYRFGDSWKLGLLLALLGAVAVLPVPAIWSF